MLSSSGRPLDAPGTGLHNVHPHVTAKFTIAPSSSKTITRMMILGRFTPLVYAAFSKGICFNSVGAAANCLLTSYFPCAAGSKRSRLTSSK